MGTELEVIDTEGGISLFKGIDAIEGATAIANRLQSIIEKKKLYTQIGDKKHVHVEGWTTLGALLTPSVYAEVDECVRINEGAIIEGYLVEMERWNKYAKPKPCNETYEKFVKKAMFNKKKMKIIPDPDGEKLRKVELISYKSTISLYVMGTRIRVGRAFSICTNLEEGKLDKPEYAIASQSETRATGKAFRLAFSWIMVMAGYAPTPPDDVNDGSETVTLGGGEDVTVENPTVTPAVDKPKKFSEIPVPKDTTDAVNLWKMLVAESKKLPNPLNIREVVKSAGIPTWPPKSTELPKLIPILASLIDIQIAEAKK